MTAVAQDVDTGAPADPDTDLARVQSQAARVDAALAKVNALPDPVQVVAIELKDALDDLHREGLTRIIRTLRADDRGRELLFELVDEPEVLLLFQLHGLVREPDLATQVALAFAGLEAQGLVGEVAGVEGTTALLTVPSAVGCSGADVKEGIRRALQHEVPRLTAVEFTEPEKAPTLISLSSLKVRSDWVDGPDRLGVLPGQLRRAQAGSTVAVLLTVGEHLAGWVNACPQAGEPLDGGRLDADEGTLVCAGHGLEFDAVTGECLTLPGVALSPVRVRVLNGRVQLLPPELDRS